MVTAKTHSRFCIPKLVLLAVLAVAVVPRPLLVRHDTSAGQGDTESNMSHDQQQALLVRHDTSAGQGDTESNMSHGQQQALQRPILYQHFHKSGGSRVCGTMRRSLLKPTAANGTASPPILNCNALGYSPQSDPRLSDATVTLTCEGLVPFTVNQGIPFTRNNFVAMEIPIDQAMPCPGFRNFALMRHPVTRFLSHKRVHKWTETRVREAVHEHERLWNIAGGQDKGWGMSPEAEKMRLVGWQDRFILRVYPCTNNLVIRQLLGLGRKADDYHAINEEDLAQAKRIVDQFDAIAPLERQNEAAVQALLQRVVPEYYDSARRKLETKNSGRDTHHPSVEYHPSVEFVAFVREQNKFDLQLYEYLHDKLGLFFNDTVTSF